MRVACALLSHLELGEVKREGELKDKCYQFVGQKALCDQRGGKRLEETWRLVGQHIAADEFAEDKARNHGMYSSSDVVETKLRSYKCVHSVLNKLQDVSFVLLELLEDLSEFNGDNHPSAIFFY